HPTALRGRRTSGQDHAHGAGGDALLLGSGSRTQTCRSGVGDHGMDGRSGMGENTVAPHRAWPHETIDQAVRRRARDRPTEIAVVGPALTLTWQELDEAADRTAHLLAERGVGPGSLVGWFGQNDIGYPVVLLAAWRRRRSEEHTSELQSRFDLGCRLLR